ncbi:MAG: tetratricopeptide repeat protein [Leptospiraceae bacterium]|nr:tetratricopeptide repeat protein [Leptospiraceae bacterium]
MKRWGFLAILISLNSFLAFDTEEFEKSFFQAQPKTNLEKANLYSAQGAIYHAKGLFVEAVQLYEESIKIRNELGLQKTPSYANLLFLNSIAEHKSGNSCKAKDLAKKAIQLWKELGHLENANIAKHEGLTEFENTCKMKTLSKLE